METQPTEMTYAAELKSIIDSFDQGFRADVERKIEGQKLRIDLLVYHHTKLCLILEIKRPEIYPSVNSQQITAQAKKYAKSLIKKHVKLVYFGTHNLKHLLLYKRVRVKKKELLDFQKSEYSWQQVRPYPWRVLSSATKMKDYEGHLDEIIRSVKDFLLDFKTILEGKIKLIKSEIVQTIASQLESIASVGSFWFFEKYQQDRNFQEEFSKWLRRRGVRRLDDDDQAKFFLKRLAMEQAYTLTLKLMFYHILRLRYEKLSSRLSDISISGTVTPQTLKAIMSSLFRQAVVESGDFQVVFETDFVDNLELPKYVTEKFVELFNFLREFNWRSIDYDIIGTIFEDMIYEQRRHLLGQYFTRSEVVDLILALTMMSKGAILDPCVGSGTFLVRGYQRWRYLHPEFPTREIIPNLFGIDIDKNVAMLAAINIYIRDPQGVIEHPRISRIDFFSEDVRPNEVIESLTSKNSPITTESLFKFELPKFATIVANPPYTRQEEMEEAFYSSQYKSMIIENAIKPVILEDGKSIAEQWSRKASIYTYFLMKSASEFLAENGRLGFITSNSWLDSSFGEAMKKYFLRHFRIIAIIESSIERWFEDADINTAILVLQKLPQGNSDQLKDHTIKFVSLKMPLLDLVGNSPSGFDITEMRNYWRDLDDIVKSFDEIHEDYSLRYCGKNLKVTVNDSRMRVITIPQKEMKASEKWSVFLRGPKTWFNILSKKQNWFNSIGKSKLIAIRRGFTTNANELYYLPSKHWKVSAEREKSIHILRGSSELVLPKSIVKPVVKSSMSLRKYSVEEKHLKRLLIYLNQPKDGIKNRDALRYINWMENLVASEYFTNNRFPTMAKKLFNPELNKKLDAIPKEQRAAREKVLLKSIAKEFLDKKPIHTSPNWFVLPDRKAANFFCVPGINDRFAFYLNKVQALEDKRLYGVHVNTSEIPTMVYFAVLNCSLTNMANELWGRTELGQGALDLTVEDYEAMPILDVEKIWSAIKDSKNLKKHLHAVTTRMEEEATLPIEKELKKDSRKRLDKLLLSSILGLSSNQVDSLRISMIKLVEQRLSRSRTIGLKRRQIAKKH